MSVAANVTRHVVLSGLKLGSEVVVTMVLKDAMVYAVGFVE